MNANWVFSQSSGALVLDDETSPTMVIHGWSGQGAGYCNHNLQSVPGLGPIPVGKYTIGPMQDHITNTGIKMKAAMKLTPFERNQMFGRGGFYIHGFSASDQKLIAAGKASQCTSSEGCVIAPLEGRNYINTHGIRVLEVTA